MSFGAGGSLSGPADADFSGVQMLLNVISLLTDPERVAADIREWAEAGKKLAIARAEHDEAARLLQEREARCAKREQNVAATEVDTAARAEAAAAQMALAERRLAEVNELRADLRKAWAA
jgi:hypothetical protein